MDYFGAGGLTEKRIDGQPLFSTIPALVQFVVKWFPSLDGLVADSVAI
jgi:hypothetical protein